MLEVRHVTKEFHSGFFGSTRTKAVDDVCLSVAGGEVFGLAGGSGSGKTTISRIILGLLRPDEGSVVFDGDDVAELSSFRQRKKRKDVQMVFQNPQKTFNPRFTVYECCAEPLRLFGLARNRADERRQVYAMLERVGISADQLNKYPHEISGGQAQRVAITRVLALNPRLIVCDEPTSMLDVSVQAQIIDVLRSINKDSGVSLLFISHDLDVIRNLCTRMAVMDRGRVVETGTVGDVLDHPQASFTSQLVAAAL